MTEHPHTAPEIIEYCNAATEGPWISCLGSGYHLMTAVKTAADPSTFIADCLPDYALGWAEKNHVPNMQFIANARTDLPAVVEAAVELRRAYELERDGLRATGLHSLNAEMIYDATAWLEDGDE